MKTNTYKIKYSAENANIISKLINVPEQKVIDRLKIKSEHIEFQIVAKDPFLLTKFLDEEEVFTWFSILEMLD